MEENKVQQDVKRHSKSWFVITIIVVAVLALVGTAGAAYYYYYYLPVQLARNLEDEIEKAGDDIETEEPEEANKADEPVVDSFTEGWLTYTNSEYGYSFKYPPDYAIADNCKNIKCVSEQQEGDYTILQGNISVNGWPMISVSHLTTEHYNPPAGTDLLVWLPEKFPWTTDYLPTSLNYTFTLSDSSILQAIDVTIPQSPQAYSQREIYYIYNDTKLFAISMLDVADAEGAEFYNAWLETFIVE